MSLHVLRLPFCVLVALVIAFGGGAWSAAVALKATSGFGAIRLGPWTAFPDIQTASADPYARAHRADDGRLLLGRAEGLVFTAERASDGTALDGRCVYTLSGAVPTTRFWTFRVTDAAGRPVPARPFTPASLQSWRVIHRADGAFSATIGGDPAPGNWVSVDATGPVRFVLTLIDTPTAGSVGLAEIDMPRIDRKECRDA
jgi:Uncharacterized conserved protein